MTDATLEPGWSNRGASTAPAGQPEDDTADAKKVDTDEVEDKSTAKRATARKK